MKRPRVICHMATSVDGRITADGWPYAGEVRAEYERIHQSYTPDGWICGRVTMEPFAGAMRSPRDVKRVYRGKARPDYRAPGEHKSFAFAVDAGGRLAWKAGEIDGDHVVAVLSERVSNEYLASLRKRGVSYILAGKGDVDLARALARIASLFGVKTLMLEGGGKINGGMLRAGLIDEVSILVVPVVHGLTGTPALFDVDEKKLYPATGPAARRRGFAPRALLLEKVEWRPSGMVWIRYRVDGAT